MNLEIFFTLVHVLLYKFYCKLFNLYNLKEKFRKSVFI
jgi:hypothetical protein